MDAECIVTEIAPKLRGKSAQIGSPFYLSLSSNLAEFNWSGGDLKALLDAFLDHAVEMNHPGRSVRVSIHEKERMSDLENFFSLHPHYWFRLCVEGHSTQGFEKGARQILENLGYHCSEWIGVEGSESQLGAFHCEAQVNPALILFVQSHGSRRTCDFLIPVLELPASFAPAI